MNLFIIAIILIKASISFSYIAVEYKKFITILKTVR